MFIAMKRSNYSLPGENAVAMNISCPRHDEGQKKTSTLVSTCLVTSSFKFDFCDDSGTTKSQLSEEIPGYLNR
jgi:hypothetical protein